MVGMPLKINSSKPKQLCLESSSISKFSATKYDFFYIVTNISYAFSLAIKRVSMLHLSEYSLKNNTYFIMLSY